jgi:antitoxin YefM
VASAETTHERTVLTKNGRPAAVLMSVDDLESLEETLALLSDRRLVARMGRAAYDHARARVRADLLASPDAAVRERAALYA